MYGKRERVKLWAYPLAKTKWNKDGHLTQSISQPVTGLAEKRQTEPIRIFLSEVKQYLLPTEKVFGLEYHLD